MDWEAIIGLICGALSVLLVKVYEKTSSKKQDDKKNIIGVLEDIVTKEIKEVDFEKIINEKNLYIEKLEQLIIKEGITLPEK